MKRNFSEQEKQNLLSMVKDVENEKICDFTDWIGDKGLEFSQWIGWLDLKHYLKNVDEYHRKLIDMNNTSDATIKRIFDDVYEIDHNRASSLSAILEKYKALDRLVGKLSETMDVSSEPFSYGRVGELVRSITSKDIIEGYDIFYIDDQGNVQIDWNMIEIIFSHSYLVSEDMEKLIALFGYMETVDAETYAKIHQKLIDAGYSDEDARQIEEYLQKRDIIRRRPKTFDELDPNNGYGGNQGDMIYNHRGDEELYRFIRQYVQYKDYDNQQIEDLMSRINNEGCGYTSMVNNIFVEFEGREKEFEEKFGFPMYDRNGNPNYNLLLVDLYTATDDQYFLDDPMGTTAYVHDRLVDEFYDDEMKRWNTEAFKRKYGCDLFINGDFSPAARQKILDEVQGQSVVSYQHGGTNTYSFENRFSHYMDQKGISYTVEVRDKQPLPNGEEIERYIKEGKNVNIRSEDFNMYDEHGNRVKENVGGHRMTVTGVAPDGRYIVSSWGEKYYLKPEELNAVNFMITDITV